MYMATLERGKTGGIGYVYGKFRKFCDDVPHVKSDSIESSGMQLAVGGGGGAGLPSSVLKIEEKCPNFEKN